MEANQHALGILNFRVAPLGFDAVALEEALAIGTDRSADDLPSPDHQTSAAAEGYSKLDDCAAAPPASVSAAATAVRRTSAATSAL